MTATAQMLDPAPADPGRPATADLAPTPPRRAVSPALAAWSDPHPRIGWALTAVIAVFTILTRFWALGFPPGRNVIPKNGMNFDEVYYAVEAQEFLRYGYEDNRGYLFIVHPPLGKLLIALSERLWDDASSQWLTNSIGWRIAPAVAGCAGVIMMTRIVRRMLRSNLFGFIGGLLMAMEGMSLVLARTAILDTFLQTFVIAGFGALVLDREQMRARLGSLIVDGADLAAGPPSLGPRPWRLVAGVMLGLACAVKWTGLAFLIAMIVLTLCWDHGAFTSAGVAKVTRRWLPRCVLPAAGSLLAAPVFAYLLTYLGWFSGENSFDRHWADTHSSSTRLDLLGVRIPFGWGWLPGPIRSLGSDTLNAYRFHEGLDSPHSYGSKPWSWLVLGRPVDFYYNGSGTTCGASSCAREVLLIGTPLEWWAFVPMLLWLAWHWFTTRDWRAGAIAIAFLAGWLFWFQDLSRTMFLFYMAPLVPFLIIGLTMALGAMLGPGVVANAPDAGGADSRHGVVAPTAAALRRRRWGLAAVSAYLSLVVLDFAWMWPIFTGGLLTYNEWHAHMWLPSWV